MKYRLDQRRLKTATWPVPLTGREPVSLLISYAMLVGKTQKEVLSLMRWIRRESDVVMLDSGAFTARRMDSGISVHGYCNMIDMLGKEGMIDIAVNLDVGSQVQMKSNFRKIRAVCEGAGVYPLPVHQPFMGWPELKAVCLDYPYIGMGAAGMDSGAHGVVRAEPQRRYYAKFHEIAGPLHAGGHGFALTAMPFLYDPSHRYISVDSSSWVVAGRFGYAYLIDHDIGLVRNIPVPYRASRRNTERGYVIPTVPLNIATDILNRHGLSIKQWNKLTQFETCAVSAASHMAVSDALALRYGERDPVLKRRLLEHPTLTKIANANGPVMTTVVIAELSLHMIHHTVLIRNRALDRAGVVHDG